MSLDDNDRKCQLKWFIKGNKDEDFNPSKYFGLN